MNEHRPYTFHAIAPSIVRIREADTSQNHGEARSQDFALRGWGGGLNHGETLFRATARNLKITLTIKLSSYEHGFSVTVSVKVKLIFFNYQLQHG
jgi:hypothetical protein